jgi:DnaJ homolog subfamily C member 13
VADVLQLMATGEPSLVAGAAALLETVLRHDGDALPRLYATGAFFFALAYCGSNLLEVARLLRVNLCRASAVHAMPWPCRQPC